MRIVQVINSLNIGGAEKLVLDLSLQFASCNHKCDIILLTRTNSIFEKKLKQNKIKIINLNSKNIYNPFIIFRLIKTIKNNYDIVITHLFPAQYWVSIMKLFSNNSKTKFITIEHSCNNGRRKYVLFKKIDKFIYKQFDKIISISPEVYHTLIEWISPTSTEIKKYITITNGVDIQKIRNIKSKLTRKEYNIPEDAKIVMCIARLEEVKNHKMQILALTNCSDDIHLVLVGDGTLRDNLKLLAEKEKVNNRVHFLGIQDDIPSIIQISDIVILTSKWEGLPLSCIEGMSIRPFIGTNVNGIRDIVKGFGILVEPDNHIQLSKEITKILTNREYYTTIKNNCYERANSYDIQRTVEKYIDTFKSLNINTFRMKLIFVGNTAWGMYNFRKPILEYFAKQDNEVIVLTPNDKNFQKQIEVLGCECRTIDIEAKGNNPIKDMKTMWQIRKILKDENPDCCFFYTIKPNIYGSMAAASLNIPYIPITTGLGYVFLVDNLVSKIAKLLYKIAFRKAKQVWFLNQDDVDAFEKENLVDKKKISILKGEGIDVSRFEVHHNKQEISFLLVARMLWDKGVGEFVEAAKILKAKYPEVKFKLLGFLGVDNPSAISKEQMDEWIKEGTIEYLGTTKDVRPFLYDATCIVLPSYREGISFSLMEGAAAGKPLVATNAVGCKDIVDDGITGFLCNVKDAEDLAKQMEKIILMPEEERIQMGLRGREKMKNEFGIDIVIKKYVEILNGIR